MHWELASSKGLPTNIAQPEKLRQKEGAESDLVFAEISTTISPEQLAALLRRMEAERQVIAEIVYALNQTANLDGLLAGIHQALKKVLPAEHCFVALHDSGTDTLSFPFENTYDQRGFIASGARRAAAGKTV